MRTVTQRSESNSKIAKHCLRLWDDRQRLGRTGLGSLRERSNSINEAIRSAQIRCCKREKLWWIQDKRRSLFDFCAPTCLRKIGDQLNSEMMQVGWLGNSFSKPNKSVKKGIFLTFDYIASPPTASNNTCNNVIGPGILFPPSKEPVFPVQKLLKSGIQPKKSDFCHFLRSFCYFLLIFRPFSHFSPFFSFFHSFFPNFGDPFTFINFRGSHPPCSQYAPTILFS